MMLNDAWKKYRLDRGWVKEPHLGYGQLHDMFRTQIMQQETDMVFDHAP